MRHLYVCLMMIGILIPSIGVGQDDSPWKFHEGFQSVFQDVASGEFEGTANGVLFVKRSPQGGEIILDFQGGDASLFLKEDEHEIYDLSTKMYTGYTTSGKTQVRYETYARANSFNVQLGEVWYGISSIDGACDMAVGGIDFLYKAEKGAEYLILSITRELELTNWTYLNDQYLDGEDDFVQQSIFLLPGSTLVFAIKR